MDEPDPCIENPWQVESLSCYLFYCCPECDVRSKTHQEFVNHAVGNHKMAVVLLRNKTILNQVASDQNQEKQSKTVCAPLDQSDPLQLHEEPKDIQSDSLTIKEEINEDDNLVSIDEYENHVVPMSFQESFPLTNVEDEDYPVVVSSELPRERLIAMCREYKIFENSDQGADKIRSKLETHLKNNHPILNHIFSLPNSQLRLFHNFIRPGPGRGRGKISGLIARFYFTNYPNMPLRQFLGDMQNFNSMSAQKILPTRLVQEMDQPRTILPGCDQVQMCEESGNASNVMTELSMNEKLVATEVLEESQQDAGEMMDPLDVLPEEEVKDVLLDSSNLTAKDCSILTIPSHLSEVELKQLCLKHFDDQFYQENNISVIEKKLQRKLKMIHPIFPYLMKMSQEKLDMLFSLHDENVVSDVSKTMMCKKLRKIYFAKHPLNPLASLIKDERSIIVHISREGLKTCNDEFEVEEVNELSDDEEFDNSHMADYSVLNIPMNLDSSLRGVMKTLSEQLHLEVNSKRDTKWYARRLSSFLRECHPIHRYIANLPKDQFDALYRRTFANGLAPFLEIPKAIAKYYFDNHHKTPLTSLMQDIQKVEAVPSESEPDKCEKFSDASKVIEERIKENHMETDNLIDQCEESSDASIFMKHHVEKDRMSTEDQLGTISFEEIEDVPLPAPNLTRKELMEICQQEGVHMDKKSSTKLLYDRLSSKLKRSHPVRSRLLQMEHKHLERLYDLIVKLNLDCHFIEDVDKRRKPSDLKEALINYYFNKYPTCPLKTLKQHLKIVHNDVGQKVPKSSLIGLSSLTDIPILKDERKNKDDAVRSEMNAENTVEPIMNQVASDQNQEKQSKTVCAPLDQSDQIQLHGESNDIQSNSLTIKEEINEDDNLVLMDEYENHIVPMSFQESLPSTNVEDQDYPVVVSSELPRECLIQMCHEFKIESWKKSNEQIRSKLKTHLKKNHPILNHIFSLSISQLRLIQNFIRPGTGSGKSRELRASIASFYFKNYPNMPLRQLLGDLKKLDSSQVLSDQNQERQSETMCTPLDQSEMNTGITVDPLGVDPLQEVQDFPLPPPNVQTQISNLKLPSLVPLGEMEEDFPVDVRTDNLMDEEDMMDSLKVIPLEEMRDYSLPSKNLSRDELKKIYIHHGIYIKEKNSTEQMYSILYTILKKRHPVRSYILHMPKEVLQSLYDVVINLDNQACHFINPKQRGRITPLRKSLINYYFKTHPTCPLETLKQHLKSFKNSNLSIVVSTDNPNTTSNVTNSFGANVMHHHNVQVENNQGEIAIPTSWNLARLPVQVQDAIGKIAIPRLPRPYLTETPNLQAQEMEEEDMMDPLDDIPLDEMKDYPLPPPTVSRDELKEIYLQHGIYMDTKIGTEVLYRRLLFKLKKRHPARFHLWQMQREDLLRLYGDLVKENKGCHFINSKDRGASLKEGLIKYYFKTHPTCPLEMLKQHLKKIDSKVQAVNAKEKIAIPMAPMPCQTKEGPNRWGEKLSLLQNRPLPGEENLMDEEDMMDPLKVIPIEEMRDYPLPSKNLTRDELRKIYVQHGIYIQERNDTERLYSRLCTILKKRHPVRSHILHMPKEDLQSLYDVVINIDCHSINPKERGRTAYLRKALIKYYFKTHPTCPLETLKQHLNCFEKSNLNNTDLDNEGQKDPYLFYKKMPSFVIQFSDHEDSSIKVPLEWSKEQVFAVFDSKPGIYIEDYSHCGDYVRYKPKMSTKVSEQGDEDCKKSMTTVQAQEKLEAALKRIHPIHKVIKSFKIKEASLLIFFTGQLQFNLKKSRSNLANICFGKQPESPIGYLQTLINKYESLSVEAKKTLMQDYSAAVNDKKLTTLLQDKPWPGPGHEDDSKIPSFVIRHCDNEDYEDSSVEIPERLSKEQILEEFEDREIFVKDNYKLTMTIEQARAKFRKVLEKAHPIHQLIASLKNKEAGVLIPFAGSLSKLTSKQYYDIRLKLASICFEKQPEAPIAYLKTLHTKYESLDLEDKKILLQNYNDSCRRHRDTKEPNKAVEKSESDENSTDIISHQETEDIETKPTQEELKTSDMKFMSLRLHKIKVESDVLLKGPDSKKRKVDNDQDMDCEPVTM